MNDIIISIDEIEEPPWLPSFNKACKYILELRNKCNWEVSVLLCNDMVIHQLNKQYRGKDCPTDVLSFSQNEGEIIPGQQDHALLSVGDIAISLDTIKKNAQTSSVSEKEELLRVFIHGFLHLEGFTHSTRKMEEPMLKLQENLLKEALINTEFIKER
jgi:probable rRNA maturation factor